MMLRAFRYDVGTEGDDVGFAPVADIKFLPGTGRGTSRRLVEGAFSERCAQPHAPSTTRCAGGPPPRERGGSLRPLPNKGGYSLKKGKAGFVHAEARRRGEKEEITFYSPRLRASA
jgi:hypothetical protein